MRTLGSRFILAAAVACVAFTPVAAEAQSRIAAFRATIVSSTMDDDDDDDDGGAGSDRFERTSRFLTERYGVSGPDRRAQRILRAFRRGSRGT